MDIYASIRYEEGLARFIPANMLGGRELRTIAEATSRMALMPQYSFTARPVNRFLGGPTQPMSSSMGASLITDMVWHQLLPAIFASLSRKSIEPLIGFRPDPFASIYFTFFLGVPVGLYKLGSFRKNLNLQRLTLQITGNRPVPARHLGKLLKDAVHSEACLPRVGEAIVHFVRTHKTILPADLVTFVSEAESGNRIAMALVENCLAWGQSYNENNDSNRFAECVRRIDWITPISVSPWCSKESNHLLVRDAAKVGALIGVLAAEFVVWRQYPVSDKPLEHAEEKLNMHEITAIVLIAVVIVLANEAVRLSRLRRPFTMDLAPDAGVT